MDRIRGNSEGLKFVEVSIFIWVFLKGGGGGWGIRMLNRGFIHTPVSVYLEYPLPRASR